MKIVVTVRCKVFARAKAEGKYVGRRKDTEKRKIIASLLKSDHSYSDIQKAAKCSRQLIATVSKVLKSKGIESIT